jgi:hypothetical protein
MKTLSRRLQRLETLCWCVGVPLGRAISSPASVTASISILAAFSASLVKRRELLWASQCGWCLLKSPSQMQCADSAAFSNVGAFL